MNYFDTSIIIKTYVYEANSEHAIKLIEKSDTAIPISHTLSLEFENALQLKVFRKEIESGEANRYRSAFMTDLNEGYFYYPTYDPILVYKKASDLSKRISGTIGSRSLDILHVAFALHLKCDTFTTFDTRQNELANAVGLKSLD